MTRDELFMEAIGFYLTDVNDEIIKEVLAKAESESIEWCDYAALPFEQYTESEILAEIDMLTDKFVEILNKNRMIKNKDWTIKLEPDVEDKDIIKLFFDKLGLRPWAERTLAKYRTWGLSSTMGDEVTYCGYEDNREDYHNFQLPKDWKEAFAYITGNLTDKMAINHCYSVWYQNNKIQFRVVDIDDNGYHIDLITRNGELWHYETRVLTPDHPWIQREIDPVKNEVHYEYCANIMYKRGTIVEIEDKYYCIADEAFCDITQKEGTLQCRVINSTEKKIVTLMDKDGNWLKRFSMQFPHVEGVYNDDYVLYQGYLKNKNIVGFGCNYFDIQYIKDVYNALAPITTDRDEIDGIWIADPTAHVPIYKLKQIVDVYEIL